MKLIEKLFFAIENFDNDNNENDKWKHDDGRVYDPELKYKPPVITEDNEYIDTNYDREDYLEDYDHFDENNYVNESIDRYSINNLGKTYLNKKTPIDKTSEEDPPIEDAEENIDTQDETSQIKTPVEKPQEIEEKCSYTNLFDFNCKPKTKIFIIGLIFLTIVSVFVFFGFLIYYFLFSSKREKETTPIDNDLPITTSQQIGSETIQAEGSSSTFSGVFNKMFGRDDELKNRSIVKQISSVQPRPSSKNAFNQSNDVLNKQLEDVQIKQTNENQSDTYDISIQDKINKESIEDTEVDDEDVAKDDEEVVKNDEDTEVDDEDVVKDDEEVVKNDEDTEVDDEDVAKDDEDVVKDDEDVVKDDEDVVKDDEDVVKDDEDVVKDDEDVAKDDENAVKDDEELNIEELDDIAGEKEQKLDKNYIEKYKERKTNTVFNKRHGFEEQNSKIQKIS